MMSLHHSLDAMDYESWMDYYYYDYDYNESITTLPEEKCQFLQFPHGHWILPTLYSIFFLVGFLGNVVVIAMVSKRTSRRADTFILNLAVSDLLFVFTLPLWASSLAHHGYWPFGVYLCKASGFVIAVTRCSSSFLMAAMSVDRYLSVIKGKKMHPLRTQSYSLVACCTIWAISILVGCPSLVSRDLDSNSSACVDSYQWWFTTQYKMVLTFLTFVLPFAVILFCYCSMAKYLWNYFGKQERAMTSTGKPKHRHRWLRIVSCVVGAFCFSWLPFNALNTVRDQLESNMTCSTKVAIGQALSAVTALAFANSCSNPLIYALLDSGFRRRARQSLPGLFLTCRSALHMPTWTVSITSMSMESTTPTLATDEHARLPRPRLWRHLMQTILRKICKRQAGT